MGISKMSLNKRKNILIAFFLFAVLNLILYAFSPADSFIASDTPGYISFASQLVNEGTYDPEWRYLPGYLMFLASFLLFMDNIGGPVVFIQVLLLFVSGLIAMKITENFLPRYGFLVFLLVIFNPNALYYAQVIVPDNLFSFFLVISLLFLIKAYRENSLKDAVFSGICAGLMTLIRPNGLYLMWTVPVFIITGSILVSRQLIYRKLALLCIASLGTAFLVLSPLLYHNWVKTGRLQIINEDYRNHVIYGNLAHSKMMVSGIPQTEAEKAIEREVRNLAGITDSEWSNYTYAKRYSTTAAYVTDILLDYSPLEFAFGMTKALGIFFFSGSASAWLQFFHVDALKIGKLIYPSSTPISISQVLFNNGVSFGIYGIALGFVLVVRALGILGCVAAFKQRKWEFIIIPGGYIVFFTFICGFAGYSRYRVPIEPLLAMFAVWGVEQLRLLMSKRREFVIADK